MRNGSSRWNNLGDDFDGMYGTDDENVEYVGVIEEKPAAGLGSNGAPPVPTTVSRMRMRPASRSRVAIPQPQPPAQPSVVIPTGSGEVHLNAEAVQAAQRSPAMNMGGRAVRRAAPGTYLVMSPSRWDNLGQAPVEEAYAGGLGTNGAASFDWGGLVSSVLETGGQITGTVLTYQQQQAELRARREAEAAARDAELEAARAQRESQSAQAQREFELQLERIRTLREAGNETAAREAEAALPGAVRPGVSPVVWVLVALVGAGAIGTVVYFVTKKDKDKDKE
jgi:hypothetical protein